ncbi:MAG: ketoacyl-ACP synthase III [Archangium gephyra]|uniref:Ketoacyl-ACP synthase III n=1 Tax=Archangium gephyra TaxID=48 RepID=A0A2W5TVE5_9BACT|nr:MAG: ketoacyl-ACP synthase III [Archangium gephyra]
MKRHARITGTGRAVAPVLISNEQMDARFGEGVSEWIEANVGIKQRFHMAPDQVTSDLAAEAAKQALERAKLTVDDVDLIIVSTDTGDQPSPSTAAVVLHKLGARHTPAFDVNAACSGWVVALDTAAGLIRADETKRHVLVIGAYGMSRFLDWTDKHTATLFADGAGAVVLSASDTPGFLASTLWSDSAMWDALGVYAGGAKKPEERGFVKFVRKFPKTYNTEHWPRLLATTSDRCGVPLNEVKAFFFTQLNLRAIEAVMDGLGLPRERAPYIGDKWGYTGNACIPMTLDDAVERGVLQRGDVIALCASGGGVSMASAFLRWDP